MSPRAGPPFRAPGTGTPLGCKALGSLSEAPVVPQRLPPASPTGLPSSLPTQTPGLKHHFLRSWKPAQRGRRAPLCTAGGQCPSLCLPAVFPVRSSHTVLQDPLSVPLPPVSFSTELIPTTAKLLFLQVRSPQSCSGFKHPKTPLHGHKTVCHLNPSPATDQAPESPL